MTEHKTTAPDNRLLRAMVADPPLRVVVALMTGTCAEAAARHGLQGLAAVCLGRGLVAGMLMATLTKGGERVTLSMRGDGPLRGLTVDANDLGEVRGYVVGDQVVLPGAPGIRLSTASALGTTGEVAVFRDLGLKELYEGHVSLHSGEVDEDLERYLTQSEQMPSALRCDVALDEAGGVAWAGGVLVQTAPGAEAEAMRPAVERVTGGWLLERLRGAADVHAEMSALLGHPTQMLEWRDVRFHCACDGGRVVDALRTLGTAELREMVRAGQDVEVGCRFCGRQHQVSPAQLQTLLDEPTDAN